MPWVDNVSVHEAATSNPCIDEGLSGVNLHAAVSWVGSGDDTFSVHMALRSTGKTSVTLVWLQRMPTLKRPGEEPHRRHQRTLQLGLKESPFDTERDGMVLIALPPGHAYDSVLLKPCKSRRNDCGYRCDSVSGTKVLMSK